jgi:hypothetical protein
MVRQIAFQTKTGKTVKYLLCRNIRNLVRNGKKVNRKLTFSSEISIIRDAYFLHAARVNRPEFPNRSKRNRYFRRLAEHSVPDRRVPGKEIPRRAARDAYLETQNHSPGSTTSTELSRSWSAETRAMSAMLSPSLRLISRTPCVLRPMTLMLLTCCRMSSPFDVMITRSS